MAKQKTDSKTKFRIKLKDLQELKKNLVLWDISFAIVKEKKEKK